MVDHESAPQCDWIAGKNPYECSLNDARAYPDSIVVLEGDDGGETYVVSPIDFVRCNEATLRKLLHDLDEIEWPGQADMAHIYYIRARAGTNIGGGMGGDWVTEGVWIHERLERMGLRSAIQAVLDGRQGAIR